MFGVTPQLSDFVCTFHLAALGSSHKHTIYAFIIYSQICAKIVFAFLVEGTKISKKDAVCGPLKSPINVFLTRVVKNNLVDILLPTKCLVSVCLFWAQLEPDRTSRRQRCFRMKLILVQFFLSPLTICSILLSSVTCWHLVILKKHF